jgi:hypothetical protein
MQVLESYDLSVLAPISTLGTVNDGAFRGIALANNDIFLLRLPSGFSVIDDLTFSRASVPEPTTIALLLIGLIRLRTT